MNEVIESFMDRFNYALSIRNIKPVELAEKTGISKSTISHYMSGYTKPKSDKLFILAKALDVNETWLMGYDVPINRNPNYVTSLEYDASNLFKHSKNEEVLLKHFSKLNLKGEEEAIKRVYELSMIKDYTDNQEEWLEEISGTSKIEAKSTDTDNNNIIEIDHCQTFAMTLSDLMESDKSYLEPVAAHDRTDIEVTDEMKHNDQAIVEKVKKKYRK